LAAELRIPCRSGASLAARAWGDADAPLRVLALHGWMDNANSWELLGPALGGGCHVVALDLPGHGRTAHTSSSAEYSQVEHAYAAYDALDALGWLEREGGFSLLGHSMGGGVCCLIASALPEHVRRLALVEGFGPLSRPADAFSSQLRDALRKRHAAAVGEGGARERTYRSLEDAAGTRVNGAKRLPGNQYMSLDAALALARRGTEAADDGGALRFAHDRRLAHPASHSFHEEQVLAVLGAIGCATMLVQAADGWPRPEPGFSARVRAMQPGLLRVVELTEGSHYAHLDPATSGMVQEAMVPFLLERT
jgi:pimeloyl-ACP methyl ester carboxylesterase